MRPLARANSDGVTIGITVNAHDASDAIAINSGGFCLLETDYPGITTPAFGDEDAKIGEAGLQGVDLSG